jgi:uncharacterized membrane protein YdjX (TVP38/TMEM64 family)
VWKRILLVALLLGALAAAWALGLHQHLNLASLRALVERAGWWGPLVFVALFSLEGLGMPGIPWMLTAIAVWPPWQAFALNWLGCMAATAVGFWYARTLGREFVAARLPERMRRFERRVIERGFQTVFGIRLALFIAPYVHWALGLSPIGFRTYMVASGLAYLPTVAFITFFGASAFAWLAAESRAAWAVAIAAGLALLVALLVWRRRRAAVPVSARD